MNAVFFTLIDRSTAAIAAGSVVSSTWTLSAPFGTPNVCRNTSGARLLPPIPISTASVTPSATSWARRSSSSGTRSSIRSATWSQPSRSRISCSTVPFDFQSAASFSEIRRTTAACSSWARRPSTAASMAPRFASWAPTSPALSCRFLFAISSSNFVIESANNLTPSTWRSYVTLSMSMPTAASSRITWSAPATFSRRLGRTSPCSLNAIMVCWGMVLTVSGPISSSTYSTSL